MAKRAKTTKTIKTSKTDAASASASSTATSPIAAVNPAAPPAALPAPTVHATTITKHDVDLRVPQAHTGAIAHRNIDLDLTTAAERQVLRDLQDGLVLGRVLVDGKPVTHHRHAIRWLLRSIAMQRGLIKEV